jgi:capsid protein
MSFSDTLYKFATGQWRVDRARAKEFLRLAKQPDTRMQLYAGAEPGTKRPYPNILSTPEDFKQAYERIVLIRAARQMEEDFQFFDGILNDFQTYVVGDLRYLPRTGNMEADKAIADFLEWQFDSVDSSERLDLSYIARLALRSMKRDGEVGFIVYENGDGIRLRYIEGDCIGNPLIGANIGPNNYNGIIIDETSHAPIFYDIFRRLPKLNAYTFEQRIDANFFIHYYEPFRFSQYHGVTVFKNSIEHAFDIKQIIDFSKLNIKWRSAQLPTVSNEQGKPRGSGYETQTPSLSGDARPMSIKVDDVFQNFVKIGEGIVEYPNDFPNHQFVAIMEELKRDIAVGCKLPLEFCYRSQTGGVVQRFYANKAERTFDNDKRWLKRTLLEPVKNRIIQKGIDTGMLDLSGFGNLATDPARQRGTWQMGKAVSVDYKNEVEADIKQIEAGVMSPQEYASENGKDIDVILQETEEFALKVFQAAARVATATKQDIAVVLPFIVKKFPNPGAGLHAAGDAGTEPSQPDQQGAEPKKELDPFAVRQAPE